MSLGTVSGAIIGGSLGIIVGKIDKSVCLPFLTIAGIIIGSACGYDLEANILLLESEPLWNIVMPSLGEIEWCEL